MFSLSKRSLSKLEGVHPELVNVVKLAITLTKVDFGVTYGVRTKAEQEELVKAGRSQTNKSYHLLQTDGFAHAVDLMAYCSGKACWELNVYDDLCDAMKDASKQLGNIPIKWGAAWSEGSITSYTGTAEDAMNAYIDLRRSQGRRPFLDGPHFELMYL
jgi:peptidoglycan L-alanyl-D-glutamate endopeptidase CwlK|tara:strand:+ start:707 stop:1180 length:474 start_codon:yes stop_codon:yes gene_type:complete